MRWWLQVRSESIYWSRCTISRCINGIAMRSYTIDIHYEYHFHFNLFDLYLLSLTLLIVFLFYLPTYDVDMWWWKIIQWWIIINLSFINVLFFNCILNLIWVSLSYRAYKYLLVICNSIMMLACNSIWHDNAA